MQLTIHITQVMQIKIKKVLIIPTLCTQTAIHSLHFVPSLRRAVIILYWSAMCSLHFVPCLQCAINILVLVCSLPLVPSLHLICDL